MVTDYKYQFVYICIAKDLELARKIALGLTGPVKFTIGCGKSTTVTHHGAIVPSTQKSYDNFIAAGSGKTPPPMNGEWSDYDVDEKEILPCMARMHIDPELATSYGRVEHFDIVAEENNLVRINKEIEVK